MTEYSIPTTFRGLVDPGHAWLMVTIDDVNAVGLSLYDFSTYSFVEDGLLFLEEDVDATLFGLAYEATTGRAPEFILEDVWQFDRAKPRLPGGLSAEQRNQKIRALDLLIRSRALAEGEAA